MVATSPARAARKSGPRVAIDRHKAAFQRGDGTLAGNPQWAPPNAIALWSRVVAVMALSFTLLACAATSAPHIGKTAQPDNRLPLAELPPGETIWKAKDLDLHYKATQVGDNLAISGFVAFGSNLGKYPVISNFRVYLHFLDAQGVVLDSSLLWAVGVNQEVRFVRWTFERQWPLPPDAVALGFSYRGGALEAGGKNKLGSTNTGWEVYRSP